MYALDIMYLNDNIFFLVRIFGDPLPIGRYRLLPFQISREIPSILVVK